jgi:transcription initiation factor TFIID subunit 9B
MMKMGERANCLQLPSTQMLLSLATSLNNVPLPPISDGFGVRLPPRKQRLTNVNFNVLPNAPPPDLDEEEEESNVEQVVTEEQKERDGPSRPLGEDDEYDDEEMDNGTQSASKDATSGGAGPPTESDARGTKRRLEEDEEYD